MRRPGLDRPSGPGQLFTEADLLSAFPRIRVDRIEKIPPLRQGGRLGADVVFWGWRPAGLAQGAHPS
ncbi:MAG: hypothetical protein ABSF27_01015 [Candidatus Dormibacteria bacterium]